MGKKLEDRTFEELVAIGVQQDMDAIVKGTELKYRVHNLLELAARWQHLRQQKRILELEKKLDDMDVAIQEAEARLRDLAEKKAALEVLAAEEDE